MNRVELENLLIKEFNITDSMCDKLNDYYELIIKYNSVMNLTALKTQEDIYIKHFYDALLISKVVTLNNQVLLDIGTGAGIPGIVLKICYPNLKITLLDSTDKKCEFLRSVIKELKLSDIEVVSARAEEYVVNKREFYDIVTSRAVARLNILDELSLPYVKLNGLFISYKSMDTDIEIKEAEKGIKILGGEITDVVKLNLPNNDLRTFVKITKIKPTIKVYPRMYAKIKKNPL